jgi:hypothetical protein
MFSRCIGPRRGEIEQNGKVINKKAPRAKEAKREGLK